MQNHRKMWARWAGIKPITLNQLLRACLGMLGLALLASLSLKGQSLSRSPELHFSPNQFGPTILEANQKAIWAAFQNDKRRPTVHFTQIGGNWQNKTVHSYKLRKKQKPVKSAVFQNRLALYFKSQKGGEYKILQAHLFQKNGDTVRLNDTIRVFQNPIQDLAFSQRHDSSLSVLALTRAKKAKSTFKLHHLRLNPHLTEQAGSEYQGDSVRHPSLVSFSTFSDEALALIKGGDEASMIYQLRYLRDSAWHFKPLSNDSLRTTKAIADVDKVNGRFLINGLYRQKSQEYHSGLSITPVPLNQDTAMPKYTPFSDKIIEDVYGKNTTKKGLEGFRLKTLIPRSDGGSILLLERYREDKHHYQEYGYFGSSAPSVRHSFYYEEILILAISPEGEIQWHKVHFKQQNTVNDAGKFSSFYPFIQKARILLLYNNFRGSHLNLLYYTMNRKGELKGDILVKGKENPVKPIPKEAHPQDGNTLVVPAINEDDAFQFLKIRFNN